MLGFCDMLGVPLTVRRDDINGAVKILETRGFVLVENVFGADEIEQMKDAAKPALDQFQASDIQMGNRWPFRQSANG